MTFAPGIGVQFQTHGVPAPSFRRAAEEAVALGVDSIFLWDHLVPFTGGAGDSTWETWTLLGSIAPELRGTAVVPGVLVSPLTFRRPAILARAAATVAALGTGRFILGVGAGGFDPDDELAGTVMTQGERSARFVDGLHELVQEVCSQCDRHGVHIEIWVGGDGLRVTIPAAARLADGWSGFGPPDHWMQRATFFSDLRAPDRAAVRSVLLTIRDEPVNLAAYAAVGVDHVVRSLRPEAKGTFDLAPIAALLDQRIGLLRHRSQ